MLNDKTCKQTEYFTPPRILDPVREYFGVIGLDPATTPENPVGAADFMTTNGLTESWTHDTSIEFKPEPYSSVFVNPPYGRELRQWVAKIGEEARAGAHIIALLPGQRFEQAYWQEHVFNGALTRICFVRKRVQFLDADGTPQKSNPYGSMLYLYNGNGEKFDNCFTDVGLIIKPLITSGFPRPWKEEADAISMLTQAGYKVTR